MVVSFDISYQNKFLTDAFSKTEILHGSKKSYKMTIVLDVVFNYVYTTLFEIDLPLLNLCKRPFM